MAKVVGLVMNYELTPELRKIFRKQRKKFIAKFGREPGVNDPVFFKSDSPSPEPEYLDGRETTDQILHAFHDAKVSMAYMYAFEAVGLAPPTKSAAKKRPERYHEWADAVDSWETLESLNIYNDAVRLITRKERIIKAVDAQDPKDAAIFPSHIIRLLASTEEDAELIKDCGINPNVDEWEAYNPELLTHGFKGHSEVPQHYVNPLESSHFNRGRDEWDWDKNLSSWRPEHIHLLTEVVLALEHPEAIQEFFDGHHESGSTSGWVGGSSPHYNWSPQEVDPVVWKHGPFEVSCKAIRFFSQYALDDEHICKFFPAKQVWFFDAACMAGMDDLLGIQECYDRTRGHHPSSKFAAVDFNITDWLLAFKLFRRRSSDGVLEIAIELLVMHKDETDSMMRYHNGTAAFPSSDKTLVGSIRLGTALLAEDVVAKDDAVAWLTAAVDFMQQKITLRIKKGIHSKKVKKRLEKKLGYVPEYTVMSLRTVEADEGAKEGALGRTLLYRQLVREHYRNVRVGPQGRRRKLILVDAYERGPEDAPLIPTKKSKRIVR